MKRDTIPFTSAQVPIIRGEKLNFQPFSDYVLIEEIDAKETAGGIALPEGVTDGKLGKGRVVRVGPGRFGDRGDRIPHDVRVGDVVYIMFVVAPVPVKLAGKTYMLLPARAIVGRVEDSEEQEAAKAA